MYHLSHGFAGEIHSVFGSPWAERQISKFGYHRALRMAGCESGSTVGLPGGTVSWSYPPLEEELKWMPAGFGKWSSRLDGIRNFETVEVEDPPPRMKGREAETVVEGLLPQVISILTG